MTTLDLVRQRTKRMSQEWATQGAAPSSRRAGGRLETFCFRRLPSLNFDPQRRRAAGFLVFLLFSPLWVLAEVSWHKFDGSEGRTIAMGLVSVSISPREVQETAFREDYLAMTVCMPDQKPSEYWFQSAYGYGEVAVQGDLLLLKYGVGRGTSVRVDHVKVFRLRDGLKELVDVQSSYHVSIEPQEGDSIFTVLAEYRLKIQTDGGYTTLSFSLPGPQRGLPTEKIVSLKNDG